MRYTNVRSFATAGVAGILLFTAWFSPSIPVLASGEKPILQETVVETPTNTETPIETETATLVPTESATSLPTETFTETPTETATETPSETATALPTETLTETPVETATETVTVVPTETETETPVATETSTATETPQATPTSDQATITIVKDAQPDNGPTFVFYGPTGRFELNDNGSFTFDVPAGNHNVSEALNFGWYLADATCTNNDGGGDFAGDSVNLRQRTLLLSVAAGDDITCTFVNQARVSIIANVVVEGDDGSDSQAGFEVRLYDTDDQLVQRFVSDNGQAVFTRRIPGEYQVCVLLRDGYTATFADSNVNGSGGGDLDITNSDLRCQNVTTTPGEEVEVTLTLVRDVDETPEATLTPTETSPATETPEATLTPTETIEATQTTENTATSTPEATATVSETPDGTTTSTPASTETPEED